MTGAFNVSIGIRTLVHSSRIFASSGSYAAGIPDVSAKKEEKISEAIM